MDPTTSGRPALLLLYSNVYISTLALITLVNKTFYQGKIVLFLNMIEFKSGFEKTVA